MFQNHSSQCLTPKSSCCVTFVSYITHTVKLLYADDTCFLFFNYRRHFIDMKRSRVDVKFEHAPINLKLTVVVKGGITVNMISRGVMVKEISQRFLSMLLAKYCLKKLQGKQELIYIFCAYKSAF